MVVCMYSLDLHLDALLVMCGVDDFPPFSINSHVRTRAGRI